jgi:hypothetical protein
MARLGALPIPSVVVKLVLLFLDAMRNSPPVFNDKALIQIKISIPRCDLGNP